MTLSTTTPRRAVRLRTGSVLVALLLAVAGTLGLAGAASAVTHASAASQFSAAGVGWTSSGNVYADEGNHWDVTYYTCGC